MANGYAPFGFAQQMPDPEMFAAGRMPLRPLPMLPPGAGFTPFAPPTATGGLMPQSPQEAQDIQTSGQGAVNLATMAAPFALGPLAGPVMRGVGTLATRFPRAATTAAGAGALTVDPSQAEPPDALSVARDTIETLRRSQTDLERERVRLGAERLQFDKIDSGDKRAVAEAQRRLGLKPDGSWGPDTSKAIADHKNVVRRQVDAVDRQMRSLARDLETQQRRLTGLEGGERLDEAERNVPPFSRMLRKYGELAGTGLGFALGGLGRFGMTRHANRAAAQRAAGVEAALERRMTAVPSRTGRLNEVWREGGQGANPPFTAAPGTRYGTTVNPNAAPSSELFQAPRGITRGQVTGSDLAVMGGAGAEAGIAEVRLMHAQQELAEAQTAAERDPSEINISRLQDARDDAAFWQAMGRVGQAGVAGYGIAATKLPRHYPRPNLSRADAELANLNRLIAPPKLTRKRKK